MIPTVLKQVLLFGVLPLVVAGVAFSTACAAEAPPDPLANFRLNVKPDAFRLAGPEKPPEPPPAIPARFADRPYAAQIHRAATAASLDPALVHAVISVESAYNQSARSPKGAIGLMQLLPDTAARYGVPDPAKSVEGNLRAGTLYLRDLMQMFKGRLDLVLAAYNAGENAVIRYGERIPPYPETRAYVPAVLSRYNEWRDPPPPPPPAAPPVKEYLPGTRLQLTP